MEDFVLSVGELKGLAMKMGQIVSYVDDSLPPETRSRLAALQRWSPKTDFDDIASIIRQDLGDRAEPLLSALERAPVASASVGQVHRGALPDGTAVAVKVRHPGIEKAMNADFRAAAPAKLIGRAFFPGANLTGIVDEARAGFLSECDYEREAEMQSRFGELHAADSTLCIPRVYSDYCSKRVLTTGWQEGLRLEDYLESDPPLEERQRFGRALYSFYVGSLFRFGLFNADPHPGNLLFQPPDRLVILDHGCVRSFDEQTIAHLAQLSHAVRDDDRQRICDALQQLGAKRPKKDKIYLATREMLRSFFGPTLRSGPQVPDAPAQISMSSVIQTKSKVIRMRIPGRLLFLFRIRFGLYALLRQLGAPIDFQRLEDEYVGYVRANKA